MWIMTQEVKGPSDIQFAMRMCSFRNQEMSADGVPGTVLGSAHETKQAPDLRGLCSHGGEVGTPTRCGRNGKVFMGAVTGCVTLPCLPCTHF